MIPASEARILDRNAEALGVSTATLMEHAGKAVAEEARTMGKGPYLVLVGPGNNGGDGAVAARHLAKRGRVVVALAVPRKEVKGERLQRQLAKLAGVKVIAAPDASQLVKLIDPSGLVIDALLGTGLSGQLREPYRTWVRVVNERAKAVLSVDVPTGLGTDAAIEPDATVALHDTKEGQSEANSGRIVVRDIGIPPRAATHTGPGELLLYPIPRATQHKGQGGVVLVVGGGPYTGAPALAAMAALRAGADLAVVLTPGRAAEAIQGYSPNLIVRHLNGYDVDLEHPDNLAMLDEFLPRTTAVVVGNGMGRADRALRSVGLLLQRLAREEMPVLLDADALHAVGREQLTPGPRTIVTPHAGEFRAMVGEEPADEDEPDKRAEQARAASQRLGSVVLLKGHESVITDGSRVKFNSTGNPAMSHGGSGDVLAGVAGALLGKGLQPFDAARLGAWMTGRAGDLAFEEQRFGLLATDIIDALPAVMREGGLHWRRAR
ncbi:MAG TPA: NAD(P)H-hydrate dehydratase [Candidatus Thermoplasmatota archaeon]|nr:NAD(P)H-hydrate dehydratase [Candidatus Thermoplasmatota archaeon]